MRVIIFKLGVYSIDLTKKAEYKCKDFFDHRTAEESPHLSQPARKPLRFAAFRPRPDDRWSELYCLTILRKTLNIEEKYEENVPFVRGYRYAGFASGD